MLWESVNNMLREYINIQERQYWFMPGEETQALFSVWSKQSRNLEVQKYVKLLFIRPEKAGDHTSWKNVW